MENKHTFVSEKIIMGHNSLNVNCNELYRSFISDIDFFSVNKLKERLNKEFQGISEESYNFLSRATTAHDSTQLKFALHSAIPGIQNKQEVIATDLKKEGIKYRDIDLIDYTCTQGISALSLIENLVQIGLNKTVVKRVFVIDDDKNRLERAVIHLEASCKQVKVVAINKPYFELLPEDVIIRSMCAIHLFGDIIENVKYLPMSFIAHIKTSRYLYDKFIFYKDVKEGSDNIQTEPLKYSKTLVSKLGITKVCGKYDRLKLWVYCIYEHSSLDDLNLMHNKKASTLCIDDYEISHRTGFHVLEYSDELIPQSKPYDKNKKLNLINSYYVNDLDIIAENFLIDAINRLYDNDIDAFQNIVARYELLTKNGCYEAYNNLAVIILRTEYEERKDEAISLFKIAAEHGSVYALMNLFSYYCEEKDEQMINYYMDALFQASNELGIWEKATSYFLGIHEDKDVIRAKEYYKLLLNAKENSYYKKTQYLIWHVWNMKKRETATLSMFSDN